MFLGGTDSRSSKFARRQNPSRTIVGATLKPFRIMTKWKQLGNESIHSLTSLEPVTPGGICRIGLCVCFLGWRAGALHDDGPGRQSTARGPALAVGLAAHVSVRP
jgi:hypothetical protein